MLGSMISNMARPRQLSSRTARQALSKLPLYGVLVVFGDWYITSACAVLYYTRGDASLYTIRAARPMLMIYYSVYWEVGVSTILQ